MKLLSLILIVLFFCAGSAVAQATENEEDDLYSQLLNERGLAVKDQNEIENETQLENKNIDIEYKDALKANKCEKKHWSRYASVKDFIPLATKYKMTPYDLVFGDDYTRRNISATQVLAISITSISYVADMPEPISKKFNQDFKSEEEKTQNKKTVFNISVKRDYECYKKLK